MAKFCAELCWTEEKQQEHLLHFCPYSFPSASPQDGTPKSVEGSAYGSMQHTIIYTNFDVMMQGLLGFFKGSRHCAQ